MVFFVFCPRPSTRYHAFGLHRETPSEQFYFASLASFAVGFLLFT